MRHKSFPHFNECVMIFGKYRANGSEGVAFEDQAATGVDSADDSKKDEEISLADVNTINMDQPPPPQAPVQNPPLKLIMPTVVGQVPLVLGRQLLINLE